MSPAQRRAWTQSGWSLRQAMWSGVWPSSLHAFNRSTGSSAVTSWKKCNVIAVLIFRFKRFGIINKFFVQIFVWYIMIFSFCSTYLCLQKQNIFFKLDLVPLLTEKLIKFKSVQNFFFEKRISNILVRFLCEIKCSIEPFRIRRLLNPKNSKQTFTMSLLVLAT